MASIKKYAVKSSKKGYLWRVQYRDARGTSRTKSGFQTKDEAELWSSKNTVDLSRGEWIAPELGRVTVAATGDRWVTMQTHLKPSALKLNQDIWKNTVKPTWGDYPVSAVKPSEIQAWISSMDYSASWIRHCHNVLAQVLDLAVMDKAIRENPARGLKLPRRTTGVKVYWTMQQLQSFAKECGEREDLILMLGTAGLRWGEAIALRPRDLDPLRNRIRVERNAAKVGNGIVLGTPKTHERRTVAVAGSVMGMLMERAERLPGDGLLWEAARGGWLRSPGHNTWFDGALKRAQANDMSMERITPHGLRHVAAGLLVNAGANVLAVSKQLGHANPSITLNVYSELFDDGLDSIAATMDEGFGSGCRENVVKLRGLGS